LEEEGRRETSSDSDSDDLFQIKDFISARMSIRVSVRANITKIK